MFMNKRFKMFVSATGIVCLILTSTVFVFSCTPCASRSFGSDSTVCVCNSTYCDTINPIKRLSPSQYEIFVSNQAGLRFKKQTGSFTELSNNSFYDNVATININVNETYQSIIGFGGAFTDSAGININSLNKDTRDKLLRSYFSNYGIEYNLGRVPIGSTDFSTHAYSYDDGRPDTELKRFKLAPEDYKDKIPFIKKAQQLSNFNLYLLASAWTAPKWMKTNGEYNGFGFIKPSMYEAWANYFLKFLQSYKKAKINFWGITTGNEPAIVFTPVNKRLNSVGWLPHQMRYWIETNLGPTLRTSEFSAIQILALDDQRSFLPWYIDLIFKSPKTKNYTDGIALHWYGDRIYSPLLLDITHRRYPEKYMIGTEASILKNDSVCLGCWKNAEKYARSIIIDLNNWITGWIDWNIVLDMNGGPTYISNFLESPIIANADAGEFYKQPMFYAMGHFSKFLPRDSIRINFTKANTDLYVTALKRPDDGIVITILNQNATFVPVTIQDPNRGIINTKLTPKSVTTVLYW